MSQSPGSARDAEGGEESEEDARAEGAEAYLLGWQAINKLMRRGHSWSGHERNVAHLNLGDGTFADISHVAGFDQDLDGRALAELDFDHDGDGDLLMTGRQGPRVWLFENTALDRSRSFEGRVAFLLEGTISNREAIGARIEVRRRGSEEALVRSVHAGQGFLAQSSRWILLPVPGLEIESLEVVWPGGRREAFEPPTTDGPWRLVEGSSVPRAFEASSAALELRPVTAESSSEGPIVLAVPVPMPRLELRSPGGDGVELFGLKPGGKGTGTGRPVVLNLWSVDCAPCLRELSAFAEVAERLGRENIAFLALCVDEDPAEAKRVLDSIHWPFAWAMAPPEALDRLDAIHAVLFNTEERLALPTSFFIDADGRTRAIQRGPMKPEAFFQASDLFRVSEAQQLERALPVPGRGFWVQPPGPDAGFLRTAFLRRGLANAAAEASRMELVVQARSPAELLQSFGRDHAARGDFEAAEEAMRRALEEDPDFVPARFDLGLLLQRMERPHDAIGAYLGVLERTPGHDQARFNLALAYLQTRQVNFARRELEELRKRSSPLAEELSGILDAWEAEQGMGSGEGEEWRQSGQEKASDAGIKPPGE